MLMTVLYIIMAIIFQIIFVMLIIFVVKRFIKYYLRQKKGKKFVAKRNKKNEIRRLMKRVDVLNINCILIEI